MPILVELTIPGMASNPQRISDQIISGYTNMWRGLIRRFDSPQFRMRTLHGGFVELGWGSITLDPHLFEAGAWPPPMQCPIKIFNAEIGGTQEAAIELFEGSAHIKSHNKNEVVYTLYGQQFEDKLLPEMEDHGGNADTPMQLAIGTVNFIPATRLPDRITAQTFHAASISQATLEVYDDGVLLTGGSLPTWNGDGTFSLVAVPAGQISISGTSAAATDLDSFVDYCSTKLGIIFNKSKIGLAIPLNFCYTSQSLTIDSLSEAAAWGTKLFYTLDGTNFTICALNIDNGDMGILNDFKTFTVNVVHEQPTKYIETSWEEAEAGEWLDGGKYVRLTPQDHRQIGDYSYGKEVSIATLYTFGSDIRSKVSARLSDILSYLSAPRINVSLPMDEGIPLPGQKITVIDDMRHIPLTATFRSRNIQYDFDKRTLTIGGEGTTT
ncbi:hypothetical protein KAR91_64865 [Candidatus Pacearchaeota archaeon]|nr:hypothetical protein [Candidatus Pacearchaeota archaeon]